LKTGLTDTAENRIVRFSWTPLQHQSCDQAEWYNGNHGGPDQKPNDEQLIEV